MTVKELKGFLAGIEDDANVIMQDTNYGLYDIRIRTEVIVVEKNTESSVHTYEKKEIVMIY